MFLEKKMHYVCLESYFPLKKKKKDMLWEWRTSKDDFSRKDDTRHPMQTIYSVSVDMLIFYKHLYNFQTH